MTCAIPGGGKYETELSIFEFPPLLLLLAHPSVFFYHLPDLGWSSLEMNMHHQ